MDVSLGYYLRYENRICIDLDSLCQKVFIRHLASQVICSEPWITLKTILTPISLHVNYGVNSDCMCIRAGASSDHHDSSGYMFFDESVNFLVGHEVCVNFGDLNRCHIHRMDASAVYHKE